MKLIIASNNKGKIAEIKQILSPFFDDVISLSDAGIDIDVEETGTTFEENAVIKAKAIYNLTGITALADDSGICVDALNGEPGVFSARYAGDGRDDKQNNKKLLDKMQNEKNRNAKFVCAIALIGNGTEITAIGETHGTLLHAEQGTGGFGYDPLFFSSDLQLSFGEASAQQKNAVSHRSRALLSLVDKLKQNNHQN